MKSDINQASTEILEYLQDILRNTPRSDAIQRTVLKYWIFNMKQLQKLILMHKNLVNKRQSKVK